MITLPIPLAVIVGILIVALIAGLIVEFLHRRALQSEVDSLKAAGETASKYKYRLVVVEETNKKLVTRNFELIDKYNAIESQLTNLHVECSKLESDKYNLQKQIDNNPDWKATAQKMLNWIIEPQLEAANMHNRPIQVPGFYPDLEILAGCYKIDQVEPEIPYDFEVTEPDDSAFEVEAHEGLEYNPFTKQYDIDPNWNWGEREAYEWRLSHVELECNDRYDY